MGDTFCWIRHGPQVVYVRGMCIQQNMFRLVNAGGAQPIHGQRARHALNPHLQCGEKAGPRRGRLLWLRPRRSREQKSEPTTTHRWALAHPNHVLRWAASACLPPPSYSYTQSLMFSTDVASRTASLPATLSASDFRKCQE